ncbi:MAG TPA: ADP-forming succinate--CoA ligase subunit beta [Gammaproteobacteria bacterium]|nr:ADP-forming succinate--CoA ligase subunit beta [Gammaproteobacteria bacterium]HIO05133.1 ADP-forming succinate--CoA ligase subunit beta [Gammaproteobacteria bacterium]
MNLHEYQAKGLFREYGISVSKGIPVNNCNAIEEAINSLEGNRWVVKAQVHAGGRGKAGGVELVDTIQEAEAFAEKWLGNNLVTYQTDERGQPVNTILIEECIDIAEELYLGAVIDRSSQRLVFMASQEGGVNIEEVAASTPEKIFQVAIDPLKGPSSNEADQLSSLLNMNEVQKEQFKDLYLSLAKMFIEKDLSLLEINPLVITTEGNLICLDAKVNVDSNALYRQESLVKINDVSQEDERESYASKWNLSYVSLNGNIGCMVNGAGLAMGTMDIIKLHGGEPANFLDVGGATDSERVSEAFKIILSDKAVQAVLINIFGGIVRCDIIADGIIEAVEQVGVNIPVVVRLEGNNSELGSDKLSKSGLDIIIASGLEDAAKLVVEASRRGKS